MIIVEQDRFKRKWILNKQVMQVQDSFSAKVMLFGEYSILLGSPALSIPFDFFTASLRSPSSKEEQAIPRIRDSNKVLHEFYDRSLSKQGLLSEILDLERLGKEIDSGLWLDSSIPAKYGVGSSGALCAALYARYAYEPLERKDTTDRHLISNLRQIFISMESWFHGKSSGLDPLVIYLRHPLIIKEDGWPLVQSISGNFMKDKGKIFLLDTGQATGTATLVPYFLEHYSRQGDKVNAGKILCELNQSCITYFCENDIKGFWKTLQLLSTFQFHNLSAMIPDHMRFFWFEGLGNDLFTLKLCGSGGGGFLTGFTNDYKKTLDYFRGQNIPVIPVDIDHRDLINFSSQPLSPSK